MTFLITVSVLFLLFATFIFFYMNKDKKIKGYEYYTIFNHIEGLEGFNNGIEIHMEFYKDKIIMNDCGGNSKAFPFEIIDYLEFNTVRAIVENKKSVIGRGIVGGVILGLPGMLLGGLSGLSTKENEESIPVFLLKYTSQHKKDTIALFKLKHDFESDKLTKIIELFNKHKESIINKDV